MNNVSDINHILMFKKFIQNKLQKNNVKHEIRSKTYTRTKKSTVYFEKEILWNDMKVKEGGGALSEGISLVT